MPCLIESGVEITGAKIGFYVTRFTTRMESGSSLNHQIFELRAEDELRFEADASTIRIELLEGTAEFRGCELAQGAVSKLYDYTISNCSGYLFTWKGCRILIEGNCTCYIVHDLYTRRILNIAAELHRMRELARCNQGKFESPNVGPRVVVIGPPGSGRSTVATTLVNYSARLEQTVYVDLDVNHNDISVPGMLNAVVLDRPVIVARGWGNSPILSFPFGDGDICSNPKLYQLQIVQMMKALEARDETFPDAKSVGWIVRAPTFDSEEGYREVIEIVKMLNPHMILVLGYDRLIHNLTEIFSERISKQWLQLVNLSRSGGLIHRGARISHRLQQLKMREYFYGPARELGPSHISLPFGEKFVVVQLKLQDQLSITAMPIDQEAPTEAELEVLQLTVDRQLRHHILAVSFARTIEQVLYSNIAGYLHVFDVDMEKNRLICTSPQERIDTGSTGPIYLIKTEFKYTDE